MGNIGLIASRLSVRCDELIKENKKLKEDLKRATTCSDCGGTGVVELSHDPHYSVPCVCTVDWMQEAIDRSKANDNLREQRDSQQRVALRTMEERNAFERQLKLLVQEIKVLSGDMKALSIDTCVCKNGVAVKYLDYLIDINTKFLTGDKPCVN